jgi:hypothetical protein
LVCCLRIDFAQSLLVRNRSDFDLRLLAPDLLISTEESSPMSNEQEKTVSQEDAMAKKDIVQAGRGPSEEERWVQDALEDDEVREVLKRRKARRPQLSRQTMRPVILVLAVAASLLSNAPAAFAADGVPKFDIAKNCKAEVAEGGIGETLASCMTDEEDAERRLTESWARFAKEDKSACISETSMDGTPSYVELQTCLEIAADDKARLGK